VIPKRYYRSGIPTVLVCSLEKRSKIDNFYSRAKKGSIKGLASERGLGFMPVGTPGRVWPGLIASLSPSLKSARPGLFLVDLTSRSAKPGLFLVDLTSRSARPGLFLIDLTSRSGQVRLKNGTCHVQLGQVRRLRP
jgi:hypothetical protein